MVIDNLPRKQRRAFNRTNWLLSYHFVELPVAIEFMGRGGVPCSPQDFRPHPLLHKSLDRMMSDGSISDDVKKRIPAQHMKLLRTKDPAIARRHLMQFLSTWGGQDYLC